MARVKAIQLAVNSALPPALQNYSRALDAKDIADTLAEVARTNPDAYGSIAKKLADIGRHSAYEQGVTIKLDDLDTKFDKPALMKAMTAEIQTAKKLFGADRPGFEKAREDIWQRYVGIIQEHTLGGSKAANTGLYQSVASGARGNASQLRMMVGAPGLYQDANDRTVPIFIANSFSDGIRPAEFLASTYGARKSTLSTKIATARGGFLLKQMVQSAVPIMVTEEDCGTTNGIDVPTDNFKMLRGRVLVGAAGGLEPGSILDRHAAAQLNRKKVGSVIVRSPLTCQAKEGICAKCAGTDPRGKFYPVGEAVGATSSMALGEPITQAALNCLAVGTLVRMADLSVKRIEDIEVGDSVLGADISGSVFPVQVLSVWNQGYQPVIRFAYDNFGFVSHVDCTSIHEILQQDGEGPVKKYPAGKLGNMRAVAVCAARGSKQFATKIGEWELGSLPCRDISVDHPDELFVLANGLIVSNTKHSGGVASGKTKREFSGMDVIEQFVQIPEEFPFRAAVAEKTGRVERIEPAPQGGQFIHIDGESHYVPADSNPIVKVGDTVEQGDQLSDGLMSPADVVRLRGLGEGRRYYAERLGQILTDSGMPPDPRNVEMITRSALDDVQIDDTDQADDGVMPDDIVSYNRMVSSYTPPKDATPTPLSKANGLVLHEPKLHFSIGTTLTPKMVTRLKDAGIQSVLASKSPAPFSPSMTRLQTSTHGRDDWLAAMHTSYLASRMADGAERGADTTIRGNTHFVPPLAFGEGFGEKVRATGKF